VFVDLRGRRNRGPQGKGGNLRVERKKNHKKGITWGGGGKGNQLSEEGRKEMPLVSAFAQLPEVEEGVRGDEGPKKRKNTNGKVS